MNKTPIMLQLESYCECLKCGLYIKSETWLGYKETLWLGK